MPNSRPTIACIAVRMHSTRLPQKALADVEGTPLLLRLIERLRRSRTLDRIVICTSTHADDRVLVERAREWGVDAVAGSEDDVLSRFLTAAKMLDAEQVVRVTGDNILTDPHYIDRMVSLQRVTDAEYVRAGGLPLGVTAEVMKPSMMRLLHESMSDPSQSEYLIFYAFDPRRFHCRVIPAETPHHRPNYALTVDTPADLELTSRMFRELAGDAGGPALADVIRLLDQDPAYNGVPSEAPIKTPSGGSFTFGDYLEWHERRSAIAGGL